MLGGHPISHNIVCKHEIQPQESGESVRQIHQSIDWEHNDSLAIARIHGKEQ